MKEIGIWEIAVLALLREDAMHPYQMQRLLGERHKDEILALKRGSLYHAIGRLVRLGWIAAAATERAGRRPERTTYRITAAGRKEFVRVLRQIIAVPRHESSEFMAAMSFLVHLTPAEAVPRLEQRRGALEREIAGRSAGLAGAATHVLRINLVESEYLLAMMKAELGWIRALIGEIHSGKLVWNFQQIVREVRADRREAGKVQE
jgi:DNA-binding PadR family transcriptional regulator